jgi:hypothetical protein
VRGAAAGIVLAGVVAGNLWGTDDHFPFAPFRMYSTTSPDDGSVSTVKLEVTTTGGRTTEVSTDALGLRRAEILGRADALRERPRLLGDLVAEHGSSIGGLDRVREVRLFLGIHQLGGGRPVSYREETLARWFPEKR